MGRFEVKLTQGLVVSLQAQYSWTIPSGAWTHRRAHFKGEPEDLIKLFHNGRLRQEGLERSGHRSPTWTVLCSLQKVYGAKRIRGCTIIDAPPFFESAGNEKVPETEGTDKDLEGSSPTQDEGGDTVYWGDDQGPVVMVWDGMLPGEQERKKHNDSCVNLKGGGQLTTKAGDGDQMCGMMPGLGSVSGLPSQNPAEGGLCEHVQP